MRKSERFVVTNDDGVQSPLLKVFLAELRTQTWCADLRPVIPRDEQSWVAQSVTRFRHVDVAKFDFNGIPGFSVNGSPADCASLGITNLYPDRPDFLLSGINFGTNEGLAFYLSSGTVGGARQGMVFGCRAIALSLRMPAELFEKWRSFDLDALAALGEDWLRVSRAACSIVGKLRADECWKGVDLFTVNMPWEVTEETPVAITRIERVTYPSIFHSFEEGVFRHRLDSLIRSETPVSEPHDTSTTVLPPSDMDVIKQGIVSLSPIAYDLFPRDQELVETLRKNFDARRL